MTVHEGDLHDRDEALAFDHGRDHLPRACGGAPAAVTDIQESGVGFAEIVPAKGAHGQLTATGRFITGPLTSVFAVESDPTPTENVPGQPMRPSELTARPKWTRFGYRLRHTMAVRGSSPVMIDRRRHLPRAAQMGTRQHRHVRDSRPLGSGFESLTAHPFLLVLALRSDLRSDSGPVRRAVYSHHDTDRRSPSQRPSVISVRLRQLAPTPPTDPVQRSTGAMLFSSWRSPEAGMRLSRRANWPVLRVMASATVFSSTRATRRVPGIGAMSSPSASSHASPICAGGGSDLGGHGRLPRRRRPATARQLGRHPRPRRPRCHPGAVSA